MTEKAALTMNTSHAQTVRELAQRLKSFETSRGTQGQSAVATAGISALAALLPEGGFRGGTLVEWLTDSATTGTELLALLSVRPLLQDGATIVVFDREQTFYPPAANAWGISPGQMIVVRSANAAEELWALEQCLQSTAVALSLCRLERATSRGLRRLQLAAERGGRLGFLMRPASVRGQPAWSDVRLVITSVVSPSLNRRWRLELIRCRRSRNTGNNTLILELDDATGALSSIPQLAATAPQKWATA